MLKWSLKLVSCRTKYEPLSAYNTSLQSRVPNTILKFHVTETEKVSSCHAKKEESYAMQYFDVNVGKELIQEW